MPDMPGLDSVLPPQNKEAEEALVGAALLNPHALDEVGYIEESDFYFGSVCIIWKAIQQLRAEGSPIDFLTVSNKLEANGDLEAAGGPAKLVGLINNVPTSLNGAAYARIIKDMSRRRALLASANALAKIAYDLEHPIAEPTSTVLDAIANTSQPTGAGAVHISHGLNELVDFVNMRRLDPKSVWGIPVGFKDFDAFTGGQHAGLVTYIAGDPGAGKTKLALQMGVQAALVENGSHPVAIYSQEMPEIEIIKRVVSGRKGVTTFQMNTGQMDDETYARFLENVAELEALPIYLNDRPITLPELHADLTQKKKEFGIELFILDYLMLLSGYEDMEETPRSALLSRGIKKIATSVNIAGIAVSSTTKENMKSTNNPTMRDMRGSAQVIFDADGIVFLKQSTEMGCQNMAELHWVKFPRTVNRSGGASVLQLYIDSQYPIFQDATVREVDVDKVTR